MSQCQRKKMSKWLKCVLMFTKMNAQTYVTGKSPYQQLGLSDVPFHILFLSFPQILEPCSFEAWSAVQHHHHLAASQQCRIHAPSHNSWIKTCTIMESPTWCMCTLQLEEHWAVSPFFRDMLPITMAVLDFLCVETGHGMSVALPSSSYWLNNPSAPLLSQVPYKALGAPFKHGSHLWVLIHAQETDDRVAHLNGIFCNVLYL